MMTEIGLSDVPDELLEQIALNLNLVDYSNLGMINRRTSHLLTKHLTEEEDFWRQRLKWNRRDTKSTVLIWRSLIDNPNMYHGDYYLFSDGKIKTYELYKMGRNIINVSYNRNEITIDDVTYDVYNIQDRKIIPKMSNSMIKDRAVYYQDPIAVRSQKMSTIKYKTYRYKDTKEIEITIPRPHINIKQSKTMEEIMSKIVKKKKVLVQYIPREIKSVLLSYPYSPYNKIQSIPYKKTLYNEDGGRTIMYIDNGNNVLTIELSSDSKLIHIDSPSNAYQSDTLSYRIKDEGDRVDIAILQFNGEKKVGIRVKFIKQ